MIMKFCPNYKCVAYGRVVYTQTTRCVFCRWDLQPPRMKSETNAEEKAPVDGGESSVIADTPAAGSQPRTKPSVLRRSA
jgi:hypothetical protein